MKAYSVKKKIAASPSKVWAVLTDLSQYGQWAPSTDNIDGQAQSGNRITVHHPSGKKTVLQVMEIIPEHLMVLKGGLSLNLLTGERTYCLASQDDNTTLFTMTEVFSGLLMPILGRVIPDMNESFEAFAHALQKQAEQNSST